MTNVTKPEQYSQPLQHLTFFERGHDCINFECVHDSPRCKPNEGGSHGVHGLQIRFVVKGEEGAVQFLLFTSWIPRHEDATSCGLYVSNWGYGHNSALNTLPADLGYHSRTPMYEGHESRHNCEHLDGAPCYYDGSGLNAQEAMYTLVNGGGDALWTYLEHYYAYIFRGGEYPVRVEYDKPKRQQ